MTTTRNLDVILQDVLEKMGQDSKMRKIAHKLALNELFDYTLYERLAATEDKETKRILQELMAFEERHIEFWRSLSGVHKLRIGFIKRLKMNFLLIIRNLLGQRATFLILEAIEHYGIINYIHLWNIYKDTPLAAGIRGILEEELRHEDKVVETAQRRQLTGEDIRNLVLGLNDGLVEVLGSVGGFFATFGRPLTVAMAASIVGVAGAISMGAGAYVSVKSEQDVKDTESAKLRVLSDIAGSEPSTSEPVRPIRSAMVVGFFYILGALIPVLPIWLGVNHIWASIACGSLAVIIVSTFLASISGVPIFRKIIVNVLIAMGAVAFTYAVGWIARHWIGIEI